VDDRGDATWAGVGALRIEEPYHTPEQATATVTACLAQAYADLQVEQASFVALPGVRQAHERTGSVTATGAEHDFRVLVADTGAPE
ncbi:MAG: hypothetical protein Q4G46_09340, partial [Propionibacteriaceae bacterium]|nr:hypothetical protein [Propionibacteriaceae bacterium]